MRDAPAGYGGVVTDAISAVPGAEHWSYGSFEFDCKTERRTVPLVRDDGTGSRDAQQRAVGSSAHTIERRDQLQGFRALTSGGSGQ